ncbi:sporulation protein rmd1 [Friedmanniomyces endolithicus]|nr:sporulation protein rmd1 [Friedmanniomyces endolithicus]
MASSTSEAAPLLPSHSRPSAKPSKPSRSVTFNPQVSTSSPPRRKPAFPTNTVSTAGTLSSPFVSGRDGPSQPMLSALNSKLRRRNSSGAPLQYMPQVPASKIGPQRTTRTAQKLKLLPNPENEEDDEESGREVYSQFTRIKDPTARRDAARLGKDDRAKLPRVTAYCTASSYKMDDLMRFLKGRAKTKSAAPKLFDECLYSPYRYRQEGSSRRRSSGADQQDEQELREAVTEVRSEPVRRFSDSAIEVEENAERRREDLIDFQDPRPSTDDLLGATSSQSQLFSSSSHPFTVDDSILPPSNTNSTDDPTFSAGPETRPLTPDFDTTITYQRSSSSNMASSFSGASHYPKNSGFFTEEFNFYYTREYQARIYNDFISLKKKRDYMTKLAISHALAQSTKTSLYEDLLDSTITTTSTIPASIARTGRIALTRREINMQIGELFILRINIHLQGSVLDAPELMWAEPQLEPVYQAVRSYLEMDQRVELMQERVSVVGDLLAVLKDQLSHTHGEYLEWIVIVLIAAEILVAAINIVVDLYAGVD